MSLPMKPILRASYACALCIAMSSHGYAQQQSGGITRTPSTSIATVDTSSSARSTQKPAAADTGSKASANRSTVDSSAASKEVAQGNKLPGSTLWTFAVAALLGALGGLAATLISGSDSMHIPSRKDRSNIDLGFVSHLLTGAVAAMITVSVSPPTTGWLGLVGVALTGGVAGPAVLLAIVQRQRADAAIQEADSHKQTATIAATKESLAQSRADDADQELKDLRAKGADANKALLAALTLSLDPERKDACAPSALITALSALAELTSGPKPKLLGGPTG